MSDPMDEQDADVIRHTAHLSGMLANAQSELAAALRLHAHGSREGWAEKVRYVAKVGEALASLAKTFADDVNPDGSADD